MTAVGMLLAAVGIGLSGIGFVMALARFGNYAPGLLGFGGFLFTTGAVVCLLSGYSYFMGKTR
jgi:hypothetical protein